MARRSAPPHSAPAYVSRGQGQSHAGGRILDESSFGRFMREEIWAPEKLPGNISIATGVGLFVAGVVVVRTWGELMIPA
ncbi:hypothetical protein EXIGLDRAFT_644857 [Exidia glandulosa HHB12029]|uniref:Uncharacterized protein n=1 Tax=Exidia glandulosa HHB12029 TaxID=1314781 RepID=A0A165JFU8_EXIGL|nr:hypothetical protein EXIGLDRAFT_644857 [Exidia glandulosa HHB12029]